MIKAIRGLFYKIFLLLFLLNVGVSASPQIDSTSYPHVGKKCPPFTLGEVKYFKKSSFSSGDLEGRFVILDFWSRWCTSCFENMPKVNALQSLFKGQLTIVMVGLLDNAGVRELYEKFRQKLGLKLVVAYDSLIFTKFGIPNVPHLVWIDKGGIVKAITTSNELNEKNINTFLNDSSLQLQEKKNNFQINQMNNAFHYDRPFLVDGNGGSDSDFLFRSLLTGWKLTVPQRIPQSMFSVWAYYKKVDLLGADLKTLYRFAYFGYSSFPPDTLYDDCWQEPVLEMKDSSNFHPNFSTGENVFSYSLMVPTQKANQDFLMKAMQKDLNCYFGYDAKIELRLMPYWKLVAYRGAEAKLKTAGGLEKREYTHAGDKLQNVPVNEIINCLWAYQQHEAPFINETGIKENIDINLDAILTDLGDVRKALQKYDLDLVKGYKVMRVLVIKQPNEN